MTCPFVEIITLIVHVCTCPIIQCPSTDGSTVVTAAMLPAQTWQETTTICSPRSRSLRWQCPGNRPTGCGKETNWWWKQGSWGQVSLPLGWSKRVPLSMWVLKEQKTLHGGSEGTVCCMEETAKHRPWYLEDQSWSKWVQGSGLVMGDGVRGTLCKLSRGTEREGNDAIVPWVQPWAQETGEPAHLSNWGAVPTFWGISISSASQGLCWLLPALIIRKRKT